MKKSLLLAIITLISGLTFINAQTRPKPTPKPELTVEDLKKYTYYFDVKDGKFNGKGAEFLKKEFAKNQYFLLGEYHGSQRISEFTKALIPALHDNGYRYFGIEVGPIAVQVLSELSKDSSKTLENLRRFLSKNNFSIRGSNETPFPFFDNVSDAEFLAEAAKRDWKLFGLDQEYADSHFMLLNRMFANLKSKQKKRLKEKYDKATVDVKRCYVEGYERRQSYLMMQDSKIINDFLDLASKKNPKNRAIAAAFRKTNTIYGHGATREWYRQNSERIDYMKKNLREGFARTKFDIKKDKMLLKMGGVHTSKGFSPLSLFEVGNTLHELATFNGNNSVHIDFLSRFYVDENGKEIDSLADKNAFRYRSKAFLQMAKKDQWTIIDLRPLRKKFLHYNRTLDAIILDIFKQHDVVIIPKIEIAPTRNFDLRSMK